jgi:hypothetical protein
VKFWLAEKGAQGLQWPSGSMVPVVSLHRGVNRRCGDVEGKCAWKRGRRNACMAVESWSHKVPAAGSLLAVMAGELAVAKAVGQMRRRTREAAAILRRDAMLAFPWGWRADGHYGHVPRVLHWVRWSSFASRDLKV